MSTGASVREPHVAVTTNDCLGKTVPMASSYPRLPAWKTGEIESLNAFVAERTVVLEGVYEAFDGHGCRVVVITVLVANTAFEKDVIARGTWDDWGSYQDVGGRWTGSVSPTVDRFRIDWRIPISHGVSWDCKVSACEPQFAIRYATRSEVVWDNNKGKNYSMSVKTPSTYTLQLPWMIPCDE